MQSHSDLQYRKTPVWNTASTVTVFLFKTPAAFEKTFMPGQDEVFPSTALQRAEPWTGVGRWAGGVRKSEVGCRMLKVLLNPVHGRM